MEWLEANKDATGVIVNIHPKDTTIVEEAMGKSVGGGVGTVSRTWLSREVLRCTVPMFYSNCKICFKMSNLLIFTVNIKC